MPRDRYEGVPASAGRGRFYVVVDTSYGSTVKNKRDAALGSFRIAKVLPPGLAFPCNFGFIPGTRADDGDELDVAILLPRPLELGVVVPVRILGALRARQGRGRSAIRNDRFIASADVEGAATPSTNVLRTHWWPALESFFVSYNAQLGEDFRITGRLGRRDAVHLIRAALI